MVTGGSIAAQNQYAINCWQDWIQNDECCRAENQEPLAVGLYQQSAGRCKQVSGHSLGINVNEATRHWQRVYTSKAPDAVSWFQAYPTLSLALIDGMALPERASILDVGGGASLLVDHLLKRGHAPTVLDISAAALEHAKARLGEHALKVGWCVADVTTWQPEQTFDLWHDRAVLHFLGTEADQQAYARALKAGLRPGGYALIAGFAPGGPAKCSGLPVVHHDSASLDRLLGAEFEFLEERDEVHLTPWLSEQAFRVHLFRRRD